jgi:hypothetical protein
MVEDDIELLKIIDVFDNKISKALRYKYDIIYPSLPLKIKSQCIDALPVTLMNIRKFYEIYQAKNIYPRERLRSLVYYLFDIKIELFFIMELDVGLYNHLIYNIGFDKNSIEDNPYISLRKLSLDQNIIIKSLILWERIMNFIFYLEKGIELEDSYSKRKSKKTIFWEFIKTTKWEYLKEYEDYIKWFEETLRTPEIHKKSKLRSYFQKGLSTDAELDRILGLVNIVMGAIWFNLLDIIQGEKPGMRHWNGYLGNPPPDWFPSFSDSKE